MHVFQPINSHEIEFNPFTIGGKMGICITAEKGDKIDTAVITNVTFGKLWEKDVCLAFIRDDSYTKSIIDDSDFFSLTFFEGDKYKNALKYLKSVSGRDEDKFKTSGMPVNRKLDIPFLDDGHMVILCARIGETKIDKDGYILPYFAEKFYKGKALHSIVAGEILEIMAR